MNDVFTLFLVVAVLYVAECIVVTRRGAVAFVRSGGEWRVVHPWMPFAMADWGLVMSNPLPPLSPAFVTAFWPLSFEKNGVRRAALHGLVPPTREAGLKRVVAYSEAGDARMENDVVRIGSRSMASPGGEAPLKFVSSSAAREAAELLRRLRGANERERGIIVQAALAQSLNEGAARNRLDEFDRTARGLRIACLIMFAYALIAAPIVVWQFGLASTWPFLLGGFGALWLTIIVLYIVAHRRQYAGDGGELASGLTLLILTPLATIRAYDLLGRRLLSRFHPLAAGRVLLDDVDYRLLAEWVMRDAEHPIVVDGSDPSATAEFAEWMRQALERHLKRAGMEPLRLLTPPAREDESRRGYCPRCKIQVGDGVGTCGGCGVNIKAL